MDFIKNILEPLNYIINFRIFQIGQTPVTISSVVMFFLVSIFFFMLSRFISRVILKKIFNRVMLDEGTEYNLLRVTHYITMFVGAIVAFQFVGIDLNGLMVVFGLLSVGIGFGLQNITSNFIAGLILLFERPISVGDRVSIGDIDGDVVEINIRSTTVRSLNNISVIVPNSDFVSSSVINWSHRDTKIRLDIDVGVAYDSDLDLVFAALYEVGRESENVMQTPAPEVLHMGFGDSAWDMQLRVWVDNPKRHPYLRSEVNCAIVRKFKEKGIEIPFPQRDIHLRSPLPLPLLKEAAEKES